MPEVTIELFRASAVVLLKSEQALNGRLESVALILGPNARRQPKQVEVVSKDDDECSERYESSYKANSIAVLHRSYSCVRSAREGGESRSRSCRGLIIGYSCEAALLLTNGFAIRTAYHLRRKSVKEAAEERQ